jgi:CelD/BcsL family acetyltransferase involved in cellulose biosynthesis
MAHTIREAMAAGAREYRFLRGGEAYKYRFTDSDHGVETLLIGRGLAGRAAVAAAAAGWRLQELLGRPAQSAVVTGPRGRRR